MAKNSSGGGPKGNSQGSSGGSKGSSNKGSSSSKGTSNKGSSNTRGSGGDSKGMGNVGWGGGSKGPSFGGGSYKASTGFGKGDTGSSFGGDFGGGSKGSDKGTSRPSSQPPKQATPATSAMDAAFKNFRPDTPANTQLMQGALYTREESGGWKNLKTGQSIEGKHLDRAAMYDSLKQENMMNRGYDDLTAVKNWFSGLNPFADEPKEQAGIGPLGGWASYGGAVPGTEDTRGFFDKIGDAFTKFGWGMQDAPLRTLANLATNPMITTAASFLGGLPAIAAIKGASIAQDVITGVTDTATALKETAKTAIGYTPAGAALGEFKGLATAALTGLDKVPGAFGGLVGGKIGVGLGETLGGALADNPFGASIGAMVGGTVGSIGGTKLAAASAGTPSGAPSQVQSNKDRTPSKSPLVSKGEPAQYAQAAPEAPEADPMKYIREMQLPFYGPNYQYNPYGFPNTMIGA